MTDKQQGLVLDAESLWCKWGFNDGVMPDELDSPHWEYWDKALERLIRDHLLPLLDGVELEVWGTSHNPFRAKTYGEDMPEKFDGILVTVPWETVHQYLRETQQ